jgi:hypothetical protein
LAIFAGPTWAEDNKNNLTQAQKRSIQNARNANHNMCTTALTMGMRSSYRDDQQASGLCSFLPSR